MEITPGILRQVQMDNVRTHQIGGETDGITPDVAADMGFSTAEEVQELIDQMSVPDAPPIRSDTSSHRRLVELPGKGPNNWYNQPVTPAEARRGMTDEQIDRQAAINKAGAAAARAALRRDSTS